MLSENLIRKLNLDGGILEKLQEVSFSEKEYEALRLEVWTNPDSFCKKIRNRTEHRKLFLWLFFHFAQDAAAEYEKRGISEKIYLDTMKDLPLWVEECRRVYGETGLEEAEWLCHHVTLNLFGLGRLQFQYRDTSEEIKSRSINSASELELHIPKDSALLFDDCCESLHRAADFFAEGRDHSELRIFCHSWLLNPGLSAFLSPDSNILRFQTLFRIGEIDWASRQAEERVFGIISDDTAAYPEKTSLQRAMKKWLLEGNKCPSVQGEIDWERLY